MRDATKVKRWLWERALLAWQSEELSIEHDEQVRAAGRIFRWAAHEVSSVGADGVLELARRHIVMSSLLRGRVIDVTGRGMSTGSRLAWASIIKFIEEEGDE